MTQPPMTPPPTDPRDDDHDNAALSAMIRREARRHAPPADLARRIRQQLSEHARPAAVAPSGRDRGHGWRWWHAFALYGAGAATAWLVLASVLLPTDRAQQDALSEQIAAGHVRSLMAAHLADVEASDRHAVKPWFAGKLDYSPPVIDLADRGYPLAGGRLDYLDGRPVAALVYKPGRHVVNLFVWPAPQSAHDTAPQSLMRRGYTIVHWTNAGMQAWAVSDASPGELMAFAAAFRERAGTSATGS